MEVTNSHVPSSEHSSTRGGVQTSAPFVGTQCVFVNDQPMQDIPAYIYKHADLFCGIGGAREAAKLINTRLKPMCTVVAADAHLPTANAYHALHPEVPCVMAADAWDEGCLAKLRAVKPHLVTAGIPCIHHSSEGDRRDKLAVTTQRIPELIVRGELRTTLLENVQNMLVSSQSWAAAETHLHARCYDTYNIVLNAQQCETGSSRTRAFVVIHKATMRARACMRRMGVILNEALGQMGQGMNVKEMLGCEQDTYYLRPRGFKKAVWSALKPLRSLTSRNPGKPPASAKPHPDDEGPLSKARLLSFQEVATLLTFYRALPKASKQQRRLWLANLMVPNMVYVIMYAIIESGLLDLDDEHDQPYARGMTMVHDFDAPPPLAQPEHTTVQQQNAEHSSPAGVHQHKKFKVSELQEKIPVPPSDCDTASEPSQDGHEFDLLQACPEVNWEDPCLADAPQDAHLSMLRALARNTFDPYVLRDTPSAYKGGISKGMAFTAALLCQISAADAEASAVSVKTGEESDELPSGTSMALPEGKPCGQIFIHIPVRANGKSGDLSLMLDPGSDKSIITPSELNKLSGARVVPLQQSSIAVLRMANGSTSQVRGQAALWLAFGDVLIRHTFLVADLPVGAILGGQFFGQYGSSLLYKSRLFAPTGDVTRAAVKFFERHQEPGPSQVCPVQVLGLQAQVPEAQARPVCSPAIEKTTREVHVAHDTVIPPYSSMSVEVAVKPPYEGPYFYTGVICPVRQRNFSLEHDGVGIAATVVEVHAGTGLLVQVRNDNATPIYITEERYLGNLVPLGPEDLVVPVHGTDHAMEQLEKMRDNIQQCQAAEQVHVAAASIGEAEMPRSDAVEGVSIRLRVPGSDQTSEIAQKINAPRKQVDSACLEQVLRDSKGEPLPLLQGMSADGRLYIDLAKEMLQRQIAVFAADPKDPPVTHLAEVVIDTSSALPIADKARRWSQKEAEFILDHIKELRDRLHIKPSQGPWATNPVLVQQKGKIRFCLDYRKLNKVTVRDSHGIGNADSMLQTLGAARVLSALDLAKGYYQIPLAPEDAVKTAFRAPTGSLWQFNVAPFGLVNLPAAFTRVMHMALGDALNIHALVYIDDILVFSPDIERHLHDLEDVLARLIKAGLSCSVEKCQLFRSELKFLGHIVGANGVRTSPDLVKAMVDMEPPLVKGKVDRKRVESLCGLFNYYKKYIHRFGERIAPIARLLHYDEPQVWTDQRQAAFDELKRLMSDAPILAHPDFSLPFYLQTDACKTAVSAVLTQFVPCGEAEKPAGRTRLVNGQKHKEVVIGYFSKINSDHDSKLAATELECLALVLALNHFRPFIWGRPVTVETDASALKWLLASSGEANTKFMRWALRLQEYDLVIQHRSGVCNGNADGFSRNPQRAQVLARPKSPANECWPPGTEVGVAPPSGVRFAEDASAETEVPLAYILGSVARADRGHPFRFNDFVAHMTAMGEASLISGLAYLRYEHCRTADAVLRDEFECERNEFEAELAGKIAGMQAQLNACSSALQRHIATCAEYAHVLQMLDELLVDPEGTMYSEKPSISECAAISQFECAPKTTGVVGPMYSCDIFEHVPNDSAVPEVLCCAQQTSGPPLLLKLPNPPATEGITPSVLQRQDFKILQLRDRFCSQVINYLEQNEMPDDDDLAASMLVTGDQYTLDEDGVLLHMNPVMAKSGTVALQLVAPAAIQPLLLKLVHGDASAMHPGRAGTLARLIENYFWPGMGEDVRKYVASCLVCQKRKPAFTHQSEAGVIAPARMWQRIHVDLLGFNKQSARGHKYVLTITEALSGFVFLFPLFSKKEEEVAEKLFHVLMEVGAVEEIVSDNGKEFVNKVVYHLCEALRVAKMETSIYHPQTNKVEKVNQRVSEALTGWVAAHQENWDLGLEVLQFALRTTPHSKLGLTPFFMVYGREAYMPYDIQLIGPGKYRTMDLHSWVEKRRQWMAAATRIAQEVYYGRSEKAAQANENLRRKLKVHIGDLVLLKRKPSKGRARKLDPCFSGPWRVVSFAGTSGLTFVCRMNGRRIRTCKAHVSLMKPFHMDELPGVNLREFPAISCESAERLSECEALDSIVDRRVGADGNWEYRVRSRMTGKPEGWLPEEDVEQMVKPSELDTFHALYELRHADQMPRCARRPKAKSGATRSVLEARKLYPKGTLVARLLDMQAGSTPVYEWGEVQGYSAPRWRVRFYGGEWESFTEAQMKRALKVACILKARGRSPAVDAREASSSRGNDSDGIVQLSMPKDFGPQSHEGTLVRVMFSTGWSQGKILDSSQLRAGWYSILFDGEQSPRNFRLRSDNYCALRDAPQGSWCVIAPASSDTEDDYVWSDHEQGS